MHEQNTQQYAPVQDTCSAPRVRRQRGLCGVVFAAILILAGTSLLLNNLGLPDLGDLIDSTARGIYAGPAILMALGGLILYRWYNSTEDK